MAAIDLTARREQASPAAKRDEDGRLFVCLTAVMAILAFAAFAPSFWLQLPAGTFDGSPLLHLHGFLFSGWVLLMALQAWLAASGRLRRHRAIGLAGISLASLMVAVGVATALARVRQAETTDYALQAHEFLTVQLSALVLFSGFVAAAIALARRPGWHPRLMVAATATLLQAAVGRIPFMIIHGVGPGIAPSHFAPPPLGLIVGPELSVNLFLVAGLIYDIRKRGRTHPAWPIGLAAITVVTLLRAPVAHTEAWHSLATAFSHIAG